MIRFTGDICLCDNAFDIGLGVGSCVLKRNLQPFSKLQKRSDDIWIGNFEGVVSDLSSKEGCYRDVFRISKDCFEKCHSIIDFWGIANNHVMEHGVDAYLQMESFLNKKGKGTFGSKQHRTVVFDQFGRKIAITGYSLRVEEKCETPLYWHLPELFEIQEEYNNIVYADYKIAYIHWGVEYVDHPCVEQIKYAHWLIDLGYDLVVGMHPHVLQGYEVYKGKYIYYSLGNTVFNMNHEPSRFGAIVSLNTITGEVSHQYIRIDNSFCPETIEEDEVPMNYKFSTLNSKIANVKNIEKYVREFHFGLKAFRKSNYKDFIRHFYKLRTSVFFQIMKDFVKRRLLK